MAGIMAEKSSKTLFFISTKAAKWETTARRQSETTWKVFFCRMATFTERQRGKNKDRWKGGRGNGRERKKEGRGERERAAVTELHWPFCNPLPNHQPPLTLCLEALKHESLWEGVERQCFNQIFIQRKAGAAPRPTFNHLSLSLHSYTKSNEENTTNTTPPHSFRRHQPYSRCSFSSWGGRWATCSWTRSLQRWPTSGECSPSHQPGCTPLPWEKIVSEVNKILGYKFKRCRTNFTITNNPIDEGEDLELGSWI